MLNLLEDNQPSKYTTEVLDLLRNHKINTFTPLFIIQMISKQALLQLEQFMKKQRTFNITEFLRFFRKLLPNERQYSREEQFFIHYGLFKMFQQICYSKKKLQVSFSEISTYMAEKMPTFENHNNLQEKLLPTDFDVSEEKRKVIAPPEIFGKVALDRTLLLEKPSKSDKIQHLHRQVGQAQYSEKFKLFFFIDRPSPIINILDSNFNSESTLKTQQDISKRDMIVNFITWSDTEEKIACILGNYSISMWSKQDSFKYEVNVPLPSEYLANPFVGILYMDSMKRWVTYDNRPVFYVLRTHNYEPQYIVNNRKIRKEKQTEGIITTQLKYYSLLCIAYQRKIFLLSLRNKQIVSELHDFKTSITSVAFSQSYQALFVSTYENYFSSFQLTQFEDLIERGKFLGHKSQISLLGTIEKKPVVFSVQENSILKMFDMRDYTCYQSFSVLKNVRYKQILYLDQGICLVGSKLHVYPIQKQFTFKEHEHVIYIDFIHRNILAVTNKCVRVYDVRNGALVSVVRAIFGKEGSSDIYSVYLMDSREKIVIQNEDGESKILDTNEMSQIKTWKLDPKPVFMHYDDDNQLITQVSLGTITVYQYDDFSCSIEVRRKIINDQPISYCKVCEEHDLICVKYEDDENIYFYAYEKGKILGFLNFGEGMAINYKNVYIPPKHISKIIAVEFIEHKNAFYLLLSDQLLLLTFQRTSSSLSFILKQEISLWEFPLLIDELQFKYDQEQPLHSSGLAIFPNYIVVTSNISNLFACIQTSYEHIQLQNYKINKENYNPYRVGTQFHRQIVDLKNPLVIKRDLASPAFPFRYYSFDQKMGNVQKCVKLGNLLAVSDDEGTITLWQYPNWKKIAGILNVQYTLPKLWQIFKFTDRQIKEVEFVLRFLDNQEKSPHYLIQSIIQMKLGPPEGKVNPTIPKITIAELIQENLKKNKGETIFRTCSLREKKMILEKERDEKEKLENFEEHRKNESKGIETTAHKNSAQKQIAQTLAYFSVSHNENILRKGLEEEEVPGVKILERKLDAIMNKDEKKSIISYKSGLESHSSQRKQHDHLSRNKVYNESAVQLRANKSETKFNALTERFEMKSFKSKQLLDRLRVERSLSKKNRKTSFPKNTVNMFPQTNSFKRTLFK